MKTTLLPPVVTVTINGDLGAKNWRDPDKRGCVTQDLTLDQRREVVRRANAYSALVGSLSNLAAWCPKQAAKRAQQCVVASGLHVAAREAARALLRELGEEI